MVDNRSSGVLGIGGSFNFKSGDISGTAAKLSDEKMGPGGEYFQQEQQDGQTQQQEFYMDRSSLLSATLNSLAIMNASKIIKSNKLKTNKKSEADDEDLTEQINDNDLDF